MQIAIDARAASHPQPGGFKTYTTNLIRSLLTLDTINQYLLFLDREMQAAALPLPPNAVQAIIRPGDGWLGMPVREQIQLPWQLRRERPDLFHAPSATAPLVLPVPYVITIHDIIEFIDAYKQIVSFSPEAIRRSTMSWYNRVAQKSATRFADVIITVSNHSKRDLVRFLKLSEKKIRVIPNAHAEHFRQKEHHDVAEFRSRLSLPPQYALALISASPRKNALGLLRIYARLPGDLRQRCPLVLLLTHHLLQPTLKQHIQRLGITEQVHFLQQVMDDDLVLLYNAATVFVFPSLYEGFGLPVLEAMACGTPVIASNLTSIPEVAGDAAELCDPRNEEAFAAALLQVLESPRRRQELSQAGLAHSKQFSWRRTAELTLDVYREVAERQAKDRQCNDVSVSY